MIELVLSEKLPIIYIDVWAILISLLNLLILFLLVKKFLFKPVREVFRKRKEAVNAVYDDANKAKESAEKDKAFYEEKKEQAESEAAEIVKTAVSKAKKQGDEIVMDAKAEAKATMDKAEREIALEKTKAVNEAKNEIADISVQIAKKIVSRELNEEDHRAYVDDFINEMKDDSKDE